MGGIYLLIQPISGVVKLLDPGVCRNVSTRRARERKVERLTTFSPQPKSSMWCEDHALGPPSASHILLEYGDYEDLDSRRLFAVIRSLQVRLGQRLRIVYRHFPMAGIHRYAMNAAQAAEAAGSQGRFWDMHELLFKNQNALKPDNLIAYAESLDLDLNTFRTELDRGVHEQRVREDFRIGVQDAIYKAPGLLLNGVRHTGAWDTETLLTKLMGVRCGRAGSTF